MRIILRSSWYIILLLLIFSCGQQKTTSFFHVPLQSGWKFHIDDNPKWAAADWDDSGWEKPDLKTAWENQGHSGHDGFAWYRISFALPKRPPAGAFLNDKIKILLGKIDDYDQVFLNGGLIGENNRNEGRASLDKQFTAAGDKYDITRGYILDAGDSLLRWAERNVLALRVFDSGGPGGMYDNLQRGIVAAQLSDFVKIDYQENAYVLNGRNKFRKILYLVNQQSDLNFNLRLQIEIKNSANGRMVFKIDEQKNLAPHSRIPLTITFVDTVNVPHQAVYRLGLTKDRQVVARETVPFILTPSENPKAQINGPRVYGAGKGHPFLYRIPVSGKEPMTINAQNLPMGLVLDSLTGIIRGQVNKNGAYPTTLIARNRLGADTAQLEIRIGMGLALTPPMGWNSWNCWGTSVDDKKVRQAADILISSGLANHGWQYINIDDGWEAGRRRDGAIQPNTKFPDMKGLADYVHRQGLRLGIYSSPGPLTCAKYTGSYKYEMEDARTYAHWGIDFLKYDWCSYGQIAPNPSLPEMQKPYNVMGAALNVQSRDMVYSLCQYGMGGVWRWGAVPGGNLARTTGDISDSWESMSAIGFGQDSIAAYARPGYWNDPDMLVLGQVGWGPDLHPPHLTPDEQYTHVSLWALLAAPLIVGADLAHLDAFTLGLLSNDEVLAIDQDALGRQARPIYRKDSLEVWARPLANGDVAAGLFNRSSKKAVVRLRRDDLGISGRYLVRDIWRQQNVARFRSTLDVEVRPHGVELFRLKKKLFKSGKKK